MDLRYFPSTVPWLRWPTRLAKLCALAALWMLVSPVQAASSAYPEDAVKAVFLYRFAGYVEWPPASAADSQFTIAVLGADPVVAQLQLLLPAHPIHGKPARVIAIRTLRQLGAAQMLYVGLGFDGDLRALLAGLAEQPVLVVSDDPHGLEAGSIVNFLAEQQHVRFEVSTIAAKRAGLRISSDLLAVAEHVKTGDRRSYAPCDPATDPDPGCRWRVALE